MVGRALVVARDVFDELRLDTLCGERTSTPVGAEVQPDVLPGSRDLRQFLRRPRPVHEGIAESLGEGGGHPRELLGLHHGGAAVLVDGGSLLIQDDQRAEMRSLI